MWVNVKWYDGTNAWLREDGRYDVVASINGQPVRSIVNLAEGRFGSTGCPSVRVRHG